MSCELSERANELDFRAKSCLVFLEKHPDKPPIEIWVPVGLS